MVPRPRRAPGEQLATQASAASIACCNVSSPGMARTIADNASGVTKRVTKGNGPTFRNGLFRDACLGSPTERRPCRSRSIGNLTRLSSGVLGSLLAGAAAGLLNDIIITLRESRPSSSRSA
jgi:hypothetical protein